MHTVELRADTAAEVAEWWPELWQWAYERPEGDADAETLLEPLVGRGTERVRRSSRAGSARRVDQYTQILVARALRQLRTAQVPFPASVSPPPLSRYPPTALAVGAQKFARGGVGGRPLVELAAPTFGQTPADSARIAVAVLTARATAEILRGATYGQRRATAEADALTAYADELEPRLAGSTRPWLEVVIPHLAAEPAPQPPPIPRRVPVRLRG